MVLNPGSLAALGAFAGYAQRTPEVARAYLHFHQALQEKGYSANTQRGYRTQIRQYLAFLDEIGVLQRWAWHGEIADHVAQYRSFLKHQKCLSGNSINTAITAIVQFYSTIDISLNIERETDAGSAASSLSVAQRQEFLERLAEISSPGDRFFILLILFQGLRVTECVGLDLATCDLSADLKLHLPQRGEAGEGGVVSLRGKPDASLVSTTCTVKA